MTVLNRPLVKVTPNRQLPIPAATLRYQSPLDRLPIWDVGSSRMIGPLLRPPRSPYSMDWRLWRWRVMRKRRRMTTWAWIASWGGRGSAWRKGRVSRAPVAPQVPRLSRTRTKRTRELAPWWSLDSACSTAPWAYLRPRPSTRLWVTSSLLRTASAPDPRDAGRGQFPLGIFTFHSPSAQQTSSPETRGGQG